MRFLILFKIWFATRIHISCHWPQTRLRISNTTWYIIQLIILFIMIISHVFKILLCSAHRFLQRSHRILLLFKMPICFIWLCFNVLLIYLIVLLFTLLNVLRFHWWCFGWRLRLSMVFWNDWFKDLRYLE